MRFSEAWILTEGLYYGASREIGDIFQEDLKRSEWSEVDNHADIPLIGIAPWGVVASQEELMGIYVSTRTTCPNTRHTDVIFVVASQGNSFQVFEYVK